MTHTPPVQTHYRTCNICEAMCGIEITYSGKEIHAIKGDAKDPLSRGHICPKAVALGDFYHDPDRLKVPLKRTADGWQEISWDEAFAEVVDNIKAIQAKHGVNGFASYIGNPNAHNLGNALFFPAFFRGLRTKNRYSSASADQLPHHVASNFMFGHGFIVPIPDIDRTQFLLIIGGNPLVSNGSMMSAPDFAKRMKAIQQRGGKVVVVDPRRTETAQKADEHFFIRPERDALLLLGMIYTLLEEGLVDLGHLASHITEFAQFEEAITEVFAPERVASVVGIPAVKIRGLAREMAGAETAVCYSRMGASTQSFGGLCQWLTNALNILTGNCDKEGGAMFTLPAVDYVAMTSKKGRPDSYGRYQSRVRGLPYYNSEFPVATLAEEIQTEGEGQIKGLITIAGNPVLSSPNGKQLDEAFAELEFMVSVDIYLNETTRHANIILPATVALEDVHYDIFFNALAIRNTSKYSPALFDREPSQRHDWEILKTLTLLLTGQEDNGATPEVMLDYALQNGPYAITLDTLKAQPHGIDFGALQPCLVERLQMADSLIHLAPQLFIDDLTRLQTELPPHNSDFPFILIGRRLLRSHNTWTQNSQRLVKGKNPCTLLLNPEDALRLEIETGQLVTVRSGTGQIEIEVQVSDEMMVGVVSIPQGWGHNKKGVRMSVAQTQPGVSINDLTDNSRVDTLTGNAALNGVAVQIISK